MAKSAEHVGDLTEEDARKTIDSFEAAGFDLVRTADLHLVSSILHFVQYLKEGAGIDMDALGQASIAVVAERHPEYRDIPGHILLVMHFLHTLYFDMEESAELIHEAKATLRAEEIIKHKTESDNGFTDLLMKILAADTPEKMKAMMDELMEETLRSMFDDAHPDHPRS